MWLLLYILMHDMASFSIFGGMRGYFMEQDENLVPQVPSLRKKKTLSRKIELHYYPSISYVWAWRRYQRKQFATIRRILLYFILFREACSLLWCQTTYLCNILVILLRVWWRKDLWVNSLGVKLWNIIILLWGGFEKLLHLGELLICKYHKTLVKNTILLDIFFIFFCFGKALAKFSSLMRIWCIYLFDAWQGDVLGFHGEFK